MDNEAMKNENEVRLWEDMVTYVRQKWHFPMLRKKEKTAVTHT